MHGSVQTVSIEFNGSIRVGSIKRNGLTFKVSSSWGVWKMELDWVIHGLVWVAVSTTEIRGFIHVLPKSIERNVIVGDLEFCFPPVMSLWIEEVWISSILWPYLTNEDFSVNFDKDVFFNSKIEGSVVSGLSHCDSSIDDGNILLVAFVQFFNEFRQVAEFLGINSEVSIVVHVVDIAPDGVKRNLVFKVAYSHVIESISGVVTPPALVPSEGPLREKNWLANNFEVTGENSVWGSVDNEEHVSDSTNCDSCGVDFSKIFVVENDPVLSSSQVVEDSNPDILRVLVHVEWMSSIDVVS